MKLSLLYSFSMKLSLFLILLYETSPRKGFLSRDVKLPDIMGAQICLSVSLSVCQQFRVLSGKEVTKDGLHKKYFETNCTRLTFVCLHAINPKTEVHIVYHTLGASCFFFLTNANFCR